jgi:hypothetical protein
VSAHSDTSSIATNGDVMNMSNGTVDTNTPPAHLMQLLDRLGSTASSITTEQSASSPDNTSPFAGTVGPALANCGNTFSLSTDHHPPSYQTMFGTNSTAARPLDAIIGCELPLDVWTHMIAHFQ